MRRTKVNPQKRILAMLLSVLMIVTIIPVQPLQVSAATQTDKTPDVDEDVPKNGTATVTVSVTGDATVEINGTNQNSVSVDVGTEVPVKVTPAEGAYIRTLSVEGEVVEITKGEAYEGIIKVDADVTISATVMKEFTVTKVAGEGGKVTLAGNDIDSLIVDENTKVTAEITANEGYQISSVSINGTNVDIDDVNNVQKEITVNEDVEIEAVFVKAYTVTVTHNENGTVITEPAATIGGKVTVAAGISVKITATPSDHYRVSKVTINGDEEKIAQENYKSGEKYIKELEADKDYKVDITFAPNQYKIKANTAENGTVKIGNESVNYNESAKITVTPDDGYTVESIKANGVDITAEEIISDEMDASFELTNISEDKTIDVIFKKASSASWDDVSINKDEALRYENNQLYVYGKDAKAILKTSKADIKGIKINDKIGDWNNNTINLQDTVKICKVSLYYRAEGELIATWHEVKGVDSEHPIDIVIDKEAPEVKITPEDSNENGFYKDDVSVTILVKDQGNYSQIDKVEYWILKDGKIATVGSEDSPEQLYSYDENNPVYVFKKDITVKATDYNSDNVVVYVKATDRAGNVKTVESRALNINATPPTAEISINGTPDEEATVGYYNSIRKATIVYHDRASTFDKEAAENGIIITAKNADESDASISKPAMISWEENEDKDIHKATITFDEEANYKWEISYTNKAGLSIDKNQIQTSGNSVYEFTIDKTSPDATISLDDATSKWETLLSKLTFGIFKNHSVTARVTNESDNLSGVSKVLYYKSNEANALNKETLEKAFENGEFVEKPYTVKEREDERFAVYARITDLAGNTKYISTNGVVYEVTPSVIKISAQKEPNKNGFYNTDVIFTINVRDNVSNGKDNYSGIQSVSYRILSNNQETESGSLYDFKDEKIAEKDLTYDKLKSEIERQITVKAEDNNSDNVQVVVRAVDNAGNESTETKNLAINTDKPEAKIQFGDNADNVVEKVNGQCDYYYRKTRTATITITDRESAFDEEAATKGITFSAKNAEGKSFELSDEDVVISTWSNNGNEHTATVTFNKDGNYKWKFEYTNKADNKMEKIKFDENESPFQFTVDQTPPTGTVTINENKWEKLLKFITFGLYSDVEARITATGSDETSPYKLEYIKTNKTKAMGETELDKQPFEEFPEDGLKVTENEQLVVYLKITDYAGNYSYVSSDGYIVDKSPSNIVLKPSKAVKVLQTKENPVYMYNHDSDVSVDINVEEMEETYSGIKTIEYWVECDGEKTQSATLYSYECSDQDTNGNRTLVITDWDSEKQINTEPVEKTGLLPTQEELTKSWNGKVVIDKALNNSCDVKVHVKTIDNAGKKADSVVQLDIDNTAPKVDVQFDNNAARNEKYFSEQRTATVTITERAHHFDAEAATASVQVTSVDAEKNDVDDSYIISDWTTEENLDNPDETRHTATIFFEKDANYKWSIKYADLAENACEEIGLEEETVAPFEFTVDTTEPIGKVIVTTAENRMDSWNTLRDHEFTFGFWSKDGITISGIADDATSPEIESVEYYKVKIDANEQALPLEEEDLKKVTDWTAFESYETKPVEEDECGIGENCTAYSNGLEVKDEEQFVVYIKITDLAGKCRYISTNGLIVDHEAPIEETLAPEITITPQQPINGIYNGDVNVDIKVVDPISGGTYSGLKKVTYKVFNRGIETQSNELYSFTSSDPTQENLKESRELTKTITVDSKLNNSNDVKIVVYAEDNARNGSEKETTIKIDTTNPTIDVAYDNNRADSSKHFKENRTATITVTERNFRAEDVNVIITNTDGVIPSIGEWTKIEGTGNLDDTKWISKITYSADGDYTFDISYTDLAGNKCAGARYGESVVPTTFTIDKTLPTVSVSYNNNAARNDKYFSASRTATVVINEHNFDVNRVQFTQTAALNGSSITIPSVSWSHSGDIHTATIVYDRDGDYTFDVTVKDMAGNESGAANYGNSVAAKDFVIDQTIEKPVIGGISNGGAYKGDVIPTISFNDVNYESYEVKLIRTRMGEKNVDVTEQFLKNIAEQTQGGSGIFDTFEKIVENDGIYTLTVKVVDKAGNESTEEYTFTVNRFGSVYEYDDELVNLIKDGGQYVTSVDKDLVITEYNADKLLAGSLKILVTRDGESVNVDYTSTPEVNDQAGIGSSGWYQYAYTIKASNFDKDGVYKISLASAYRTDDSEENESTSVPENSIDKQGKDIIDTMQFTVDSVAPEIRNIVNLDKAIVNAQSLDVKYSIVDVGGLKSVEVVLNGKTVDTVTEFGDSKFNYSGQFTIEESSSAQTVEIRATDLAGNVTDTASKDFSTNGLYEFNDSITVSTNAFVRWYANKALFWGTIGGIVVVIGGIWFFIATKRKKNEEE